MVRSSEKIKERDTDNTEGKAAGTKSYKIHIVQDDESLSVIAREFYGNPALWKHIYKANQHKISDPNDIHAGQELIIPELKK
ncbi:LysM peptidoglycan-binding domain-containing protein [Fulvivirga imtechensis]|nr:LysM peptidoglycan-binding domain-containing protein [Fulvivirga imtechensis]